MTDTTTTTAHGGCRCWWIVCTYGGFGTQHNPADVADGWMGPWVPSREPSSFTFTFSSLYQQSFTSYHSCLSRNTILATRPIYLSVGRTLQYGMMRQEAGKKLICGQRLRLDAIFGTAHYDTPSCFPPLSPVSLSSWPTPACSKIGMI